LGGEQNGRDRTEDGQDRGGARASAQSRATASSPPPRRRSTPRWRPTKRSGGVHQRAARATQGHLEGVEKTRLTLEQQTAEVYKAIEDKMTTAADKRDENMKKIVERLREHEEQVRKVRAGNQERFQQLESAIQEKLQQAAERRTQLEAEQKEKLRSYNCKLVEARSAASAKLGGTTRNIETKLSAAELNREKEMQRKLDFVKKEERRAELVRQNKSARADADPAHAAA
ncbi:hypothetical protein ACJJTC_016704, partial [Scirpophaga incertulas]